jgi:hypothetical protein
MNVDGRTHHPVDVFPARSTGRRLLMGLLFSSLLIHAGCARHSDRLSDLNSLEQETGAEGSTTPKARPPFYPNTSGNIVSPPGNPGGNPAGAPPIVGGTMNQSGGWPEGR